MSVIKNLMTAANPYVLWIKIAICAAFIALIVGVCWYISSVFKERNRLLTEVGKVNNELINEKMKVATTLEQLRMWQESVDKMNKAIKSIKIEANTYIEGIENEKAPNISNGSVVPLMLSGSTAATSLPRFEVTSSSRIGPAAPKN